MLTACCRLLCIVACMLRRSIDCLRLHALRLLQVSLHVHMCTLSCVQQATAASCSAMLALHVLLCTEWTDPDR